MPLLPLEDFLNPETEFTSSVFPELAGGFFASQQLGIRLKDIHREALYTEETKTAELDQGNFNILMSGHGIGGNKLLEKM